ncbi:MAG TPA: hypothetical protein VL358_04120 [Caulobacteraceae bacterium]|jgi:hypothetical protein|nr:hypothetical protein [Caulobacteraceae bacterium]
MTGRNGEFYSGTFEDFSSGVDKVQAEEDIAYQALVATRHAFSRHDRHLIPPDALEILTIKREVVATLSDRRRALEAKLTDARRLEEARHV